MVALSACYPPGKGPVARRGYNICAPAINALDAYHSDHGLYPEKLDELVPQYLPRVPSPMADRRLESVTYKLRPADSYQLEFRYVGPGMNYCDYSPKPQARWKCSGYY
jgi:hypothetical protein